MELMQANNQWRNRPSDERFTSLTDLHAAVQKFKDNSKGTVVSSRDLECAPVEGGNDGLAIYHRDHKDTILTPTNWSFGQLAPLAGAPAAYLRKLPNFLAADNINYGLQYLREIEDLGVYVNRNDEGGLTLAAATGPNYGRVYNAQITKALVERFGDGLTGDFKVPGEFGKRVEITKDNTTLYASDRDMFIFLADEEHRITVPNRRDGKSGDMARGFFVWNSEVGSTTFGIATFLFDYVCCNRIVWGAQGYAELKIRHTASAGARWLQEVEPAILEYANSSTKGITDALAEAKKQRIEKPDDFLAKRFTKSQVTAINAAHMKDEGRPIETLWDAATGITAYARDITYQDERVKLEREAGKVLDLAIA